MRIDVGSGAAIDLEQNCLPLSIWGGCLLENRGGAKFRKTIQQRDAAAEGDYQPSGQPKQHLLPSCHSISGSVRSEGIISHTDWPLLAGSRRRESQL
jgi:hypothetical protein